jgi:hypothetical protein
VRIPAKPEGGSNGVGCVPRSRGHRRSDDGRGRPAVRLHAGAGASNGAEGSWEHGSQDSGRVCVYEEAKAWGRRSTSNPGGSPARENARRQAREAIAVALGELGEPEDRTGAEYLVVGRAGMTSWTPKLLLRRLAHSCYVLITDRDGESWSWSPIMTSRPRYTVLDRGPIPDAAAILTISVRRCSEASDSIARGSRTL